MREYEGTFAVKVKIWFSFSNNYRRIKVDSNYHNVYKQHLC